MGEPRIDGNKPVCEACYQRKMSIIDDMDNPFLVVKMTVSSWAIGDSETFYLPFRPLADQICPEEDTARLAYEAIKAHYADNDIDYDVKVDEVDLVNLRSVEEVKFIDPDQTATCTETNLTIFAQLAYHQLFAHRPFEAETDEVFASAIFCECYKGEVYSKDFAYSFCEHCNRWVCKKNPSNGWMSQIHWDDNGNVECNRCFEERVLREGIGEDFNNNIPGGFFVQSDIEEHGWELVEDHVLAGSGYTDHIDPKIAINMIKRILDSGKKCLVDYDAMAIGELGAYVSIYSKNQCHEEKVSI